MPHSASCCLLLAVAYCSSILLCLLVNRGQSVVRRDIGLCIVKPYTGKLTGDTQKKQQTMQQEAVCTILQCDVGISHHHTAAAAAALTRSIEPVLLLLLLLWLCPFFNRPILNTLPCSWTHRQTDRHALSAKMCSVLKSCISDGSIMLKTLYIVLQRYASSCCCMVGSGRDRWTGNFRHDWFARLRHRPRATSRPLDGDVIGVLDNGP